MTQESDIIEPLLPYANRTKLQGTLGRRRDIFTHAAAHVTDEGTLAILRHRAAQCDQLLSLLDTGRPDDVLALLKSMHEDPALPQRKEWDALYPHLNAQLIIAAATIRRLKERQSA